MTYICWQIGTCPRCLISSRRSGISTICVPPTGAGVVRRSDVGLQRGDPRGHERLAAVGRKRALIIGQGLLQIARLFLKFRQRRQRPGIVFLNGQGFDEMLLGGVLVAEFLA